MAGPKREPAVRVFVDRRSRTVAVIPLISADEFGWAQIAIPELNDYSGYEDWRESREAFQIGLAMAGVDVEMTTVKLGPFLSWCRDTKTPPSASALETFAGRSYDLQGRYRAAVGAKTTLSS